MDRKKTWGGNTYITQNTLQNKAIRRNPEGHFTILQGRIHQKDIDSPGWYSSVD